MRITVRVEPRHVDNTTCHHKVKPSGKPRDPRSRSCDCSMCWTLPVTAH